MNIHIIISKVSQIIIIVLILNIKLVLLLLLLILFLLWLLLSSLLLWGLIRLIQRLIWYLSIWTFIRISIWIPVLNLWNFLFLRLFCILNRWFLFLLTFSPINQFLLIYRFLFLLCYHFLLFLLFDDWLVIIRCIWLLFKFNILGWFNRSRLYILYMLRL